MKYLALISGGKDSTFNILKANNEGHELVAAANLYPKPAGPDEIDSFMFQTVGSKAVVAISDALGVPLYRLELSGDESKVVDELKSLFKQIQVDFPEVQGVSVGAIASTYQQVRVDRAAQEVGLTTLAYLWQHDQVSLVDEIVASGLDVRIIKVAGAGLTKDHLGKSLEELRPTLLALKEKYGLHPAGEGGEYETIVLDGPNFNKKLQFKDAEIIQHGSGDDVHYLKFDVVSTEKPRDSVVSPSAILVPDLLAWEFVDILHKVAQDKANLNPQVGKVAPRMPRQLDRQPPFAGTDVVVHTARDGSFALLARGDITSIVGELQSAFSSSGLNVENTLHVAVILKDFENFAKLNYEYAKLFNFEGPPSRVAVQAKITDEAYIAAFGHTGDPSARGLHVQGRSFWAPANIGPYSQSRVSRGNNYLAGQIGLVPATLELATDTGSQIALALQNAVRILDTSHGSDNWALSLATVYISGPAVLATVKGIWKHFSATRGVKLPLIVLEVERLPRDAQAEWVVRAIDNKHFASYQPETEAEDGLYIWPPQFTPLHPYGYIYEHGFERLRVASLPDPTADTAQDAPIVVYSPRRQEGRYAFHVPTKRIHVGDIELSDTFLQPAQEVWITSEYRKP